MSKPRLVLEPPLEHARPKAEFKAPIRPWWLPVLEAAGVLTWMFFLLSYGYYIAVGISLGIAPIILSILLGIIGADFMSGFLHWVFDTFFESSTPIIGPHLVGPFREHHVDPLAMTRHSLLESAGNSCLAWLPVMSLTWWFGPIAPESWFGTFAYWFLLTFAFFLTISNQFHSWAHAPNAPAFARRLQSWGLIVSPEHHALHHVLPHTVRYATTTGWTNYLIDGFSLFSYTEKALLALGFPLKNPESY